MRERDEDYNGTEDNCALVIDVFVFLFWVFLLLSIVFCICRLHPSHMSCIRLVSRLRQSCIWPAPEQDGPHGKALP